MAALAIACSAFYIPARSPLMASRAIGPASAHVTLAAPPEVQVAFGMVMLLSVTHGLLPQPGGNKDARGSQQQAAARQTRTARVGAKPRRSTPRLYDSDEPRAYNKAEKEAPEVTKAKSPKSLSIGTALAPSTDKILALRGGRKGGGGGGGGGGKGGGGGGACKGGGGGGGSGKGGGGGGGGGNGRGQGNGGGWPSTTGNPSGGGRSNNPPSK